MANEEKACYLCEYHNSYENEIDGIFYDDGCTCSHREGDKQFHGKTECYSKTECPYFKERE